MNPFYRQNKSKTKNVTLPIFFCFMENLINSFRKYMQTQKKLHCFRTLNMCKPKIQLFSDPIVIGPIKIGFLVLSYAYVT